MDSLDKASSRAGMSDAPITTRLGSAVRTLRFRLDISQEELAERAGLHRTYIAGIERGGRNLTVKNVEKLARALEVSTSDLLSEAPAARHQSVSGEVVAGKTVDILLVQGNRDEAELTLQAFREAKVSNRVHLASDGAEALDYIFSGSRDGRNAGSLPQLILLDLFLPKIGGLEVLRRIKRERRTRTIPVVVLTASRNSRDIAKSRQLGAEAHIIKPLDFFSLSRVTPQLRLQWALYKPAPPYRG